MKIVATVGPASHEHLASLIEAGVDVVRVNMSYGTYAEHAAVIAQVHALSAESRRAIAVLMDLSGPKLRIGEVRGPDPVELRTGERVCLVAEGQAADRPSSSRRRAGPSEGSLTALEIAERDQPGSPRDREIGGGVSLCLPITYPPVVEEAAIGDRILLDDGALELVVEEKEVGALICRVVQGGWVSSHKGVNVPGMALSLSAVTEKDRQDIRFGVEQGVEYFGLSFVRSAADCQIARRVIEEASAGSSDRPLLIAKIEKAEAVERLEEILQVADGLMVARGDLGVEVSVESVPVLQKEIIARANRAGKFVITATQMLQSMIENPRPTRAEASDVANAVLDGTDAVLLSGETAIGRFPVEAVRMMDRIIRAAEASALARSRLRDAAADRPSGSVARALAEAAAFAAEEVSARLIVVFTTRGNMPRQVAALRPAQRVIALTPSPMTCRQLALIWGVEPYLFSFPDGSESLLAACDRFLLESGVVREGERVVLVAGRLPGFGFSETVKLHRVGESAIGSL